MEYLKLMIFGLNAILLQDNRLYLLNRLAVDKLLFKEFLYNPICFKYP